MDKELTRKFGEIDKRFDGIDKKLLINDDVHAKIVKKLLEHDGEFVKVREEARENRDMILNKLDRVLGVVNNSEVERHAIVHRTDRMQSEIDDNKKEIKKVKKVLKIA